MEALGCATDEDGKSCCAPVKTAPADGGHAKKAATIQLSVSMSEAGAGPEEAGVSFVAKLLISHAIRVASARLLTNGEPACCGPCSPGSCSGGGGQSETDSREWRVIGAYGVAVRETISETSTSIGHLPHGCIVKESKRVKERLLYKALPDQDVIIPQRGWVRISYDDHILLEQLATKEEDARGSEPLAWSPGPQSSPSSPPRAMIVFDWDDTLCPTTWIEGKRFLRDIVTESAKLQPPEAHRDGPEWSLLGAHAQAIRQVVETALSLGSVAVVTLAQKPWVATSLQSFLQPTAGGKVSELQVYYARDSDAYQMLRPFRMAPAGRGCPWTALKRQAMKTAMERMGAVGDPAGGECRRWDCLVSIGDSEAERRAAEDLGRECTQRGELGFIKTVKLRERPSITMLTEQLVALNAQLPEIVGHLGSRHVNLAELLSKPAV